MPLPLYLLVMAVGYALENALAVLACLGWAASVWWLL